MSSLLVLRRPLEVLPHINGCLNVIRTRARVKNKAARCIWCVDPHKHTESVWPTSTSHRRASHRFPTLSLVLWVLSPQRWTRILHTGALELVSQSNSLLDAPRIHQYRILDKIAAQTRDLWTPKTTATWTNLRPRARLVSMSATIVQDQQANHLLNVDRVPVDGSPTIPGTTETGHTPHEQLEEKHLPTNTQAIMGGPQTNIVVTQRLHRVLRIHR